MSFEFHVEGTEDARRRLNPNNLLPSPTKSFLEKASVKALDLGRSGAPVRSGRLRARHAHKVERGGIPRVAEAGPMGVPYAPFVHFGTERMAAQPWLEQAGGKLQGILRAYVTTYARDIERQFGRGR